MQRRRTRVDGKMIYTGEMACPHCGFFDSVVLDSRAMFDRIRRRRRCRWCEARFTTEERVSNDEQILERINRYVGPTPRLQTYKASGRTVRRVQPQ